MFINKSKVSIKKLKKAFKTIEKTGLSNIQTELNKYQEKAAIEQLKVIYGFDVAEMKNTMLYAVESIVIRENKEYDQVNESKILHLRMMYDLLEKIERYSDAEYLRALYAEVIHNRPARKWYEDLQKMSKEPLFEEIV